MPILFIWHHCLPTVLANEIFDNALKLALSFNSIINRYLPFIRDCPHSGFWSFIFGLWAMCKKSRCRSSCEFTTRGWRLTDLLYNWVYLVSTQLYRRSVRLQPRVVNSQDDRQRLFLHIAQSPNMEDQNPICGQPLIRRLLLHVFIFQIWQGPRIGIWHPYRYIDNQDGASYPALKGM